jgi:hypothetical protein
MESSSVRTTCPVYLTLLDFVIVIILCEESSLFRTYFIKIHQTSPSHLRLGLPSDVFLSGFPITIVSTLGDYAYTDFDIVFPVFIKSSHVCWTRCHLSPVYIHSVILSLRVSLLILLFSRVLVLFWRGEAEDAFSKEWWETGHISFTLYVYSHISQEPLKGFSWNLQTHFSYGWNRTKLSDTLHNHLQLEQNSLSVYEKEIICRT